MPPGCSAWPGTARGGGAPLPSDERHDVHRIAARIREALGDADFVAELRRGGRLDLADPAVLGDGQRDVSAP